MKRLPLLSAMVLLALWASGLAAAPAKDPIGAEPVWDETKDSSEAPAKDKARDKAKDKANPKPKDKAKDEPKEQSAQNIIDPFLLARVEWSGPAPTLEALKGKTVIVLAYITTDPAGNRWSGKLIEQLKAAIAGKPVVVLAINSDKSPTVPPSRQARHHVVPGIDADQRPKGVEQYLTERHFFAPNIIHGYDPGIGQRAGLWTWRYLWIDPSGKKATTRGYDASNFRDVASGQEFTLPANIAKESNLGKFKVMRRDFPDQLQVVLWPFEMGLGSEAALKKVRGTLRGDQKDKLAEALDEFLTGQLEEIRSLYKGSVEERFQAYNKAVALAGSFKRSNQSKKAREVVVFLEKDEQFKREIAAKNAYDATMQKVAAFPNRRSTLFGALAKRFEGTKYGKLAADAAEEKGK